MVACPWPRSCCHAGVVTETSQTSISPCFPVPVAPFPHFPPLFCPYFFSFSCFLRQVFPLPLAHPLPLACLLPGFGPVPALCCHLAFDLVSNVQSASIHINLRLEGLKVSYMGRETRTVQVSPAIIHSVGDLLLCHCSVVVQVTIFKYVRIASSLIKGSFAGICALTPLLERFHCHNFACVGVLDLSNIGHISDRECQYQGRINAMNCLVGDHLDHGVLHWLHTSFQQRTFVPFVSLFAK